MCLNRLCSQGTAQAEDRGGSWPNSEISMLRVMPGKDRKMHSVLLPIVFSFYHLLTLESRERPHTLEAKSRCTKMYKATPWTFVLPG